MRSLVLDPFSGSGTTARVCRRLDRDFIGIDTEPRAAELLGQEPCTDYSEPRNQIYIGDNLEVMKELHARHGAFIDLIYADPPFGRTSVDKQFGIRWRDYPVDLELLSEMYGGGVLRTMKHDVKAYLTWLHPRIVLMHKLLKPTGSLYLHCDPSL